VEAYIDAQLAPVERGETTPFIVADELLRRGADILKRSDP